MPPKSSKLCKSLSKLLEDTSSLSMLEYFIQYMESANALHILHFWYTVESFKATTSPVSHSVHSNGKISNMDAGRNSCETYICGDSNLGSHVAKDTGTSENDKMVDGKREHRVLKRRDTGNHQYCNCMIGMQQQEVSLNQSPVSVISDGNPVTFSHTCEHGSPNVESSRFLSDFVSWNQAPNHVKSKNHPSNLTLETDALEIYRKYLALNTAKPLGVTDEIRQRVEVNICPEDGKISNSCFNEAQMFVYEVLEERYYPGFLHSSFFCKYQLEYIASGNLNLMDFLLERNALSYFVEFMEQEGASSLLQFWLKADNFYNQLSNPNRIPDVEVDIADAMAIYDRYFSLQASERLDMEESVRLDVENRICDEHGPRTDSYLRPQFVAYHTMKEVYFPTFIESSIYLRFLNELVLMLNKDDEPTTQADVAEHTIPEIDEGKDMDDPDLLWKRPSLLFRLGFVNEFGQYISEIDPIPMKSSKKDLYGSRSLRKQRKEEELAMKIVRNIIKEVSNSLNSDS